MHVDIGIYQNSVNRIKIDHACFNDLHACFNDLNKFNILKESLNV